MRGSSTMRVLYTVGVLVGSLALLGCPKRPEVTAAGPGALGPGAAQKPGTSAAQAAPKAVEVPVTRPSPPAEAPVKSAPAVAESAVKDIFFKFDDATVLPDQKKSLDEDFAWLKAHPEVKVTVAGNCDERGTAEYNLALGQKRVQAAKAFLLGLGIAENRLQMISYGFERPADNGHNEAAWAKNRRVEFVPDK